VAALDAHQHSHLVLAAGQLDAGRRGDELQLVAVTGHLLLDGVDQFEGPVGVLPLVLRGIDPDGEELGAQIAFLRGFQIELTALQGIAQVKIFIHKALWSVGVGIDDQGGAMHRCGVLRFGWHIIGHFCWGLGADQRRDGGEQQGERKMGRRHRLGMSVYRKCREQGLGNSHFAQLHWFFAVLQLIAYFETSKA